MKAQTILLDPTDERGADIRARLAPLDSLEGKTVALLDIAKARGDVFLNRLEERLSEQGVGVKRFMKPTNTRNAPADLNQDLAASADAVVEALSD